MTRLINGLWPLLALLATGCGDFAVGTGELGNVQYRLHTDYELPDQNISTIRLVTGHPVRISTALTEAGTEEVGPSEQVTHTASPAEHVSVVHHPTSARCPDFDIQVAAAGEYLVETRRGDDVVDRIRLTFEDMAAIESLARVRAPFAHNFQAVGAAPDPASAIGVTEGAQVVFVSLPLAADGGRLAGHLALDVVVEPHWAAVPGANINGAYEDGWWSLPSGEWSLFFIEPGPATVTLIDPVTGISTAHHFEVLPVAKTP